jgi:hypothetical protein
MSVLFATPLAVRPPFFDINSSRGVSIPFAAMTQILAFTHPLVLGPACRMKLIWLMRPFSPTTISLATVRSIICTNPVFVASFNVMVGSYFAWIGQIGMQFVLPAQARRFL